MRREIRLRRCCVLPHSRRPIGQDVNTSLVRYHGGVFHDSMEHSVV